VLALLAVLAVPVLVGCSAGPEARPGAIATPTPSVTPIIPEATKAPASVVFASTTDGVVLPDSTATPGDVYPDVADADVCDPTYANGVEDPHYSVRVISFANYGLSIYDHEFELDKLVPVSLGGSNEQTNIWPQPYDDVAGALQKDALERQLRGLVCSGDLTLAAAQEAISTDWWAAHGTYMGLPIDPGSAGPEPDQPTVAPSDPFEVRNQGPCEVEGETGFSESKDIWLDCAATGSGELRWMKRY